MYLNVWLFFHHHHSSPTCKYFHAIFQNSGDLFFLHCLFLIFFLCSYLLLLLWIHLQCLCVHMCVCLCGMCAVIELRPGHEMLSFSCAKRADLLRNLLGTCQQSGLWEKTGKTQTRLLSGSNRELNLHSSHLLFTLAWTCLTPIKLNPLGRPQEALPSVPRHTGWRRKDIT